VGCSLVDEQGHDVKPGQPGEAWLKGPVISHGYHNNQAADKAAFQDGWYRTGDLVEIRNDLVYVLGRTRVSQ
jgi:4-coumarate--CoA ligase